MSNGDAAAYSWPTFPPGTRFWFEHDAEPEWVFSPRQTEQMLRWLSRIETMQPAPLCIDGHAYRRRSRKRRAR